MRLFGGRCWQPSRSGRQLALSTDKMATKARETDTSWVGMGSCLALERACQKWQESSSLLPCP